MITNAMFLNQCDKILRRKTGKCGTAKMRIFGKIVFRFDITISKIATTTTGDADFLRQFMHVIQQNHATVALTGFNRTHHTGGARTDDNDISGYFFQDY